MSARAGWSLLMIAVMFVALSLAGVSYTSHVQRRADSRWCDLLSTLDQPGVPPTTDRGRAVQRQIHDLRRELGCKR